jgi:hypothetical protein
MVGKQMVISSTSNAAYSGRVGDSVMLKLDEEHLHIFDATSTDSLMQ